MNQVNQASIQHPSSMWVTSPLIDLLFQQCTSLPVEATAEQNLAKVDARKACHHVQNTIASELCARLPNSLQRVLGSCKESEASSWLAALTISEHGFEFHKGAYCDAICLLYGWQPSLLPTHYVW